MLVVIQLSVLITSLVYLSIIAISFFCREKINSVDTRIYKNIVITNIISICVEMFLYLLTFTILEFNPGFVLLVSKIFVSLVLLWFVFLMKYAMALCFKIKFSEEEIRKKKHHLSLQINLVAFIACLVIICLPLEMVGDKSSGFYASGIATKAAFMLIMTTCVIIFYNLIRNFKKLNYREFTPLILLLVLVSISTVVQIMFPQLLLFNPVMSLITVIMYHTIENPDVKMIKELNIAKDVALKANNAKTEFLSSMSHEVRTPLNAIVGFSESLKEEDLNPKAKEEVDDIISASETLLEIVNGILDISKIEANKLEIVNSEYDTQKLFKELANLTKVRIGEKPIVLKVNIDESLPKVLYGDYARLKQIVLNLLTNAAKYTDKGEINFTVNSVITKNVCRLIISVKDTGRDIKKENISKLFTKFERLDEKNTTIEGTGLGLAITKKLVELMHGNIVVDSVYGKGSKFTVSIDQLVVKKPTITQVVEEEKVEVNNFAGKKVLIVDDNELNLKVAARLLQPYKMDIDKSSSGDDAISKIIDDNVYDLILLDDMMPHKSGSETLAELKQIEGFNMPVVVLTANAIEGMKEQYLKAGFDDYLAKPISKEELKRVLQKYLNK